MKISKYNSEGYRDPTVHEAITNMEKERKAKNLTSLKQRYPSFRPLVYVCSPYAGNIKANVRNARRYCRFATDQQTIPIAPHLLFPQFLNDNDPEQRELGLFMGNVLLSKCAEIWVFGDFISKGMAAEIDKAEDKHLKIRYFTSACKEV